MLRPYYKDRSIWGGGGVASRLVSDVASRSAISVPVIMISPRGSPIVNLAAYLETLASYSSNKLNIPIGSFNLQSCTENLESNG
jgi:hypothetical protein